MIAPLNNRFEELPPVESLIAALMGKLYNEKATPENRLAAADICQQIHDLAPATFMVWQDRPCHILEVKEAILEGI